MIFLILFEKSKLFEKILIWNFLSFSRDTNHFQIFFRNSFKKIIQDTIFEKILEFRILFNSISNFRKSQFPQKKFQSDHRASKKKPTSNQIRHKQKFSIKKLSHQKNLENHASKMTKKKSWIIWMICHWFILFCFLLVFFFWVIEVNFAIFFSNFEEK